MGPADHPFQAAQGTGRTPLPVVDLPWLNRIDGGTGTLALTGSLNQTFTGSATPTSSSKASASDRR